MIYSRYKKKVNDTLNESCFEKIPLIKYILKWIEKKDKLNKVKRETENFTKFFDPKKKAYLFSSIELETINRCNGNCPFCPVNKNADTRKYKYMTDELFSKIILELKAIDYRGRLAFHSNNEPFLDSKIIERVKFAKENIPNAFLYMYTNGTLLTSEKFYSIIDFIDQIIIDNYNDNLKLNKTSQVINEICLNNKEYNKKVRIELRKINEVLTTRGGQSPNNQRRKTIPIPCILPFKQIVIRPTGKVSMCCNDALGKVTMGDVRKNTLVEIWQSERYKKLRQAIKRGRRYIPLCKYCDTAVGLGKTKK